MKLDSLTSLNVCIASNLIGSKRAIQNGDTLYVSPAMWDLIEHANDDGELETLLAAIPVVQMPKLPPLFAPWR